MVTDIFTPGLTAGNPLALAALNHSIVSSGARFMPASTLHYGAPARERERESESRQDGPGRGGLTESGRVGFYSPRARHIVYPKNTLRAHAIARHAADRGERERETVYRRHDLGYVDAPAISMSAIAIEAR